MEWYWWVVIGVVVVLGGYVKLKLFKSWMDKKAKDEDE